MKVCGIDVSTKAVDLVLLADDNTAEWTHVPCADERGPFFAARKAAEFMPRGSFWDDVYLVGVERPFSQNRGTARALGLITGAVAACLPRGLTAIETAPQEWKRLTVGVANAPKDVVGQWADGEWPDMPWAVSQDALDAYCIARAVRVLNDRAIEAA